MSIPPKSKNVYPSELQTPILGLSIPLKASYLSICPNTKTYHITNNMLQTSCILLNKADIKTLKKALRDHSEWVRNTHCPFCTVSQFIILRISQKSRRKNVQQGPGHESHSWVTGSGSRISGLEGCWSRASQLRITGFTGLVGCTHTHYLISIIPLTLFNSHTHII
jgi:hypothetical protein